LVTCEHDWRQSVPTAKTKNLVAKYLIFAINRLAIAKETAFQPQKAKVFYFLT